ncbi:hypothetical protein [Pantanalinema sp. GBBB05]|uniref:hypothetical protein n=1 Tax=Pantanalinema sp. GBBB05 TaxID=2604139 RepID=UPI001DBA3D56|nr:hypothetical protein [Pantanalinema sp. GBBB05]
MTIVICPGIHDPALTSAFLAGVTSQLQPCQNWRTEPLVVPTQTYPAFSSPHILGCLHDRFGLNTHDVTKPLALVLIGFSAGVVGAIGAAWGWQAIGGQVKALIALDGWGVPLVGNFTIHRLSHDHFTHWSSGILGQSTGDSFYADPGVEHLALWRSPQATCGWRISTQTLPDPVRTTAAQFLTDLLHHYDEIIDVAV